jgi:hypothetical protein
MQMRLMLSASVLALTLSTTAWAGSGPNYGWNEAKNPGGANRCSNANQCDGSRTCSPYGWCQGTARPPNFQKTSAYRLDESRNSLGPNQCTNGMECDGARTCSPYGWCQGKAR